MKVTSGIMVDLILAVLDTHGTFHQSFGALYHAVQASWNQLKPDQSSCSACDLKGNSMAYRITSALDFNKRGCVRQI